MTKFYYASDEINKGWKRYFNLANALEVTNEGKLPSIKTLNSWRVSSPKGFGFVVHVLDEFIEALDRLSAAGASQLDEQAKAAFEASLERAKALGAIALFLPTSFEFSPTQSNRTLLEKVAELNRGKLMLVWESQGMWSLEDMRDWASKRGIVYTYDPFMAFEEGLEFGHGDVCFKINERQGTRRHFDGYDMENLIEWAQAYDRAILLFRGRFKWRHLKEWRETLKSSVET